MPRVLLVDPDPEQACLRVGFLTAFHVNVVWETESGAALRKLETVAPDAIIIDVGTSGLSARDFCSRVREAGNVIPIMATAPDYRLLEHIEMLGVGADDYFDNDTPLTLVFARLNALLRRARATAASRSATAAPTLCGPMQLDVDAHALRLNGHLIQLNVRELRCLALMMARAGNVVTREEIRNAVDLGRDSLRERSIDVLISRLKAKIARAAPGFRPIRSVRSVGYVLNAPAAASARAAPRSAITPSGPPSTHERGSPQLPAIVKK